jgi:hypothetical protein
MPDSWSVFRRGDVSGVVRIVREVAVSGDAGLHGHGVEVVLESPRPRWWTRWFDRSPRDQARIAVTGADGTAGYPIHVRLVTGHGAGATHRIERRDRWATGVTRMAVPGAPERDGEAVLVLKRGALDGYRPGDAAADVVAGCVAALSDLRPLAPDRGWRARIDRDVRRS